MSCNLNALILSELYTASNYIERLCNSYRAGTVEFPYSLGDDYVEELYQQLSKQIFITKKENFGREAEISLDNILDTTHNISEICKGMVGLDFDSVGTALKIVDVVNIMYRYGYCFHLYAYKTQMPLIALPNPPLADIVKTDYRESAISLFGLCGDKLENAFTCGKGRSLYQFQEQRERRYREMLAEAERLEQAGALDEAEAVLLKLRKVKERGEMLGLLARVQFLKGNVEYAKQCCIRGINKDPDYGPLYNDLGLYWLEEGNTAEALKWFGLSKQCVKYPQRQDAYINTGRIYWKQKKYYLALEQLAVALDMDPFNNGLREDVEELELLVSSTVKPDTNLEKMTDYSHGS